MRSLGHWVIGSLGKKVLSDCGNKALNELANMEQTIDKLLIGVSVFKLKNLMRKLIY